VAGASLEQTTFFRRNLAVKPGPQLDVASEGDEGITDIEVEGNQLPRLLSRLLYYLLLRLQHLEVRAFFLN
jgi:hypothetical protein